MFKLDNPNFPAKRNIGGMPNTPLPNCGLALQLYNGFRISYPGLRNKRHVFSQVSPCRSGDG